MDRQMIDYLPSEMREYEEFIQICKAEQETTEKKHIDINRVFGECFIDDMTESGVERWEKTMLITPKETDSLEVRKFRITAKMHEDLPYTYRTLVKQLESLTGSSENFSIVMKNDEYYLMVKVALHSRELKNEVEILLDRIVPAQFLLNVELMYNTYKMIADTGMTHAQLSAYTYKQLREEPFEN